MREQRRLPRKDRASLQTDRKGLVVRGLLGGVGACVLVAAGLSLAEYSFALRKAQNATDSLAAFAASNPGSEQWLLASPDITSRKGRIEVLPPGRTRADDLGSVRVSLTQPFQARAFWSSGAIRTEATAVILPSSAPGTGRLVVIVQ